MSQPTLRYQDVKNSLRLNRSGDASSKLSKACFPSEIPSLNLYGDRSIVNDKYLLISTTDQAISLLYTGPELQAYSAKNTP